MNFGTASENAAAVAAPRAPLSRRSFLTATAAASSIAVTALAGCTGKAPAASAGSEAAEPVTLSIGISEPAGIEPATPLESQGIQVAYQLFDPLTYYDYQSLTLGCLAAASYSANDDATQFTFKIKSASFHNGETVTSRAFKRAWERLVSAQDSAENYQTGSWKYLLSLVAGYSELQNGGATELSGVSCPDDETLQVQLSASYADFPLVCAHPALAPVPQAALDDPKAFASAPVGNGAFKMSGSWTRGQNIKLVRHDQYFGGAPAIDGLEFEMQEDADAAYKAFRAEELDVCEVPAAQLTSAENDCGLQEEGMVMADRKRMVKSFEASLGYIACNTADAALGQADLRWGLSLAIDRESICRSLYRNARVAASDAVPTGINGHRDGAWPCCEHDEQLAREYLDRVAPLEAGERALTLTLLYRSVGGMKALAEELKSQLEKTGITLELEEADRSAYEARVAAGQYQLALATWTADIPSMDAVLYPLFHSACVGGRNISRFADAETVDANIGEARRNNDGGARLSLLQAANDAVAQQAPVLPLFYYTHSTVASKRVTQLAISPNRRNDYARAVVED